MSFGKRQPLTMAAHTVLPARAPVMRSLIVGASSLAVALMAAYFVQDSVWPALGIWAKELQPLRGVRIDSMPDVTRAWAPGYLAPLVVASLAFLLWRYFVLYGSKPRILRGGLAMVLIFLLAFIVSYELPQIGRFIQMWPLTDEFSHLWRSLVALLMVGLMKSTFFMLQFGLYGVVKAFIVGLAIAGATRAAVAAAVPAASEQAE